MSDLESIELEGQYRNNMCVNELEGKNIIGLVTFDPIAEKRESVFILNKKDVPILVAFLERLNK